MRPSYSRLSTCVTVRHILRPQLPPMHRNVPRSTHSDRDTRFTPPESTASPRGKGGPSYKKPNVTILEESLKLTAQGNMKDEGTS